MGKNTIKLTESEFHRLINESVNQILNEIGDTPNGQYMLGRLHARQLGREDNWQAAETSKYANNALKKRYPDVYNKDKYSSVNDWADDLCDYSRGNVCFNLGDRDEENPIYSREKMNQPDSEYERRIRRDVIPNVSKFKP